MSQLELCRSELSCILDYVAFGIMSHSGLCHIWDYVAFSIALFGIVSFLLMLLCYVIWDYVVRYTVGVSYNYHTRYRFLGLSGNYNLLRAVQYQKMKNRLTNLLVIFIFNHH